MINKNQYKIKQVINLNFTDFYDGFDKKNNYFYRLLSKKYDIVIDEENPDYLIYSCFGKDFLNYDCIRIFYTGENLIPDFNLCDYGISFYYLTFEDRHLRYPNFLLYGDQPNLLLKQRNFTKDILVSKKEFCNFIYSNASADPVRDDFFYLLSNYRKVHSAGRHLKNIDGIGFDGTNWADTKVTFQNNYKFSIAFENSSANGYTTEKIMHAFNANTIPIYWGNPLISKDFNNKSFINCHDFNSFDEVIEEIIRLDNNDEEYIKVLNQPIFYKNSMPEYLNQEYLLGFFEKIFNQPISNAKRRCIYGYTRLYAQEQMRTTGSQYNPSLSKKIKHKILTILRKF